MKFISACYQKWPGYFVFSLILCCILPACKQSPTTTEATVEVLAADTLPREFITFFDQFHEDTAFQIAHIVFPLEGLPNSQGDADTLPIARYFWQREDWKFHRHLTDPSNQFENWFEVLDPRIIEHWVQAKGTNLFMQRRFAKLSDGWYLIYYAGMRPRDKVVEE